MHTISKLIFKDLVRGLPKFKVDIDHVCDACQYSKQTRESFKSKNIVSTSRPFDFTWTYLDLPGPQA